MGYWKSKVLPKIKKVFEKNTAKKAEAAEACNTFDQSKDEINKEFEEKKVDLQPKVLEIYEACSVEIKGLVKEPKEAGIKKSSVAIHKLLEELSKIEFPGSKAVTEASTKYGAGLVSGPIIFVLEKVSTFVPIEEVAKEDEPKKEVEQEQVTTKVEKEIVIEEDKIQEEQPTTSTTTIAPATEEPPKAAEVVEAVEPPPPQPKQP